MATGRPTITGRQVAAVALGNALEFYDFLVYAFFAVQIAGSFFPGGDDHAKLLAALATFGAGFLTRPLGALVIGGLADRVGRRPTMLASFALIGLGSAGLALMPSYARIGVAAPILAIGFRLVQGFALGGEVGASTAFLIEASPPGRRGLYVSWQFAGQNAAILVAGLVGVALSSWFGAAALADWGWRAALLAGALIVPIGLALRRSLPETLDAAVAREPAPPLGTYRGVAVIALLLLLAGTIATYVLNYLTTYATTTLHMPAATAFGATVAGGVCGMIFSPLGGWLSDRVGRRPVMLAAWTIVIVGIVPAFAAVSRHREAWVLFAAAAGMRIPVALMQAAALAHIAETLPARVRSGSLALIYALAISIFGGSTQFVVAWLIGVTGDPLVPAWYLLAAALAGLAAMIASRESAPGIVARAGAAPA